MTTLLDDDQSSFDPNKNYIEELVGEGKKFKSVEDLAKGKAESDEYIKMIIKQKDTLSNDYLKLKADYDARASLEEMLDKRQSQEPNANTPNANNNQPQQTDSLDIDKLIESRMSAREKQRLAEENVKKAKDILREKLGNRYADTLRTKMEELDLTEDEMYSLAARSPKAFVRTLGLEDPKPQQPAFQSPPSSQYNSSTFKPVTEKRTWSWYQDLKLKDPKAWLDPKIQTQMYHDAQRMGADFGDGDFAKYDERL